MCGIVGYKYLTETAESKSFDLQSAVDLLKPRGPDHQNTFYSNGIGLGHTRLSIIDTSELGNQPMIDTSGRYVLIFNGEIYNYKKLSDKIPDAPLQSTCDTEVLLYLLIKFGIECLKDLNGFFSFAFYDRQEKSLILARDRMGIKPLLYYNDNDLLVFSSEMKALLSLPIPRAIDDQALYWYLKLNYLPGNLSLIQGAQKLAPGHFLKIEDGKVAIDKFYEIEERDEHSDYDFSKRKLIEFLDQSVSRRLMADVPLGSFLSGGVDSSAIVALASRHHPNLKTFSIGYKDNPFFDETHYAELVAKKFDTDHHAFHLTNDDLLADLESIISYVDEPFADSSAIPTFILSKHVSKHVKVALSGDGADELFGGYYKHLALSRSLNSSSSQSFSVLTRFTHYLPKSRSGIWSNRFRRLDRYSRMMKLSPFERYWYLSSLTDDPSSLLIRQIEKSQIDDIKREILCQDPVFNDYLVADINMVLPGDMLTKVDLMSMANSLEVRVPFLDSEVVNFAMSLPSSYKVKGAKRKRILQDTFKEILPIEIYHRPKKGFEVPLLQWMQRELLQELSATVFNRDLLEQQQLFDADMVLNLKPRLLSQNPGDVHATVWAIYIFQKWYNRYFD